MSSPFDFEDMMKKMKGFDMKAIPEMLKQAQKMLEQKRIEAESGAGMVKVVLNGLYQMQELTLSDSAMTEDKSVLEDLIKAAYNEAKKKVDEVNQSAVAGNPFQLGKS